MAFIQEFKVVAEDENSQRFREQFHTRRKFLKKVKKKESPDRLSQPVRLRNPRCQTAQA